MNQIIREILISMGYHESDSGKWLKPIGYHLLSFNENGNIWSNWFLTFDTKKLTCWDNYSFSTSMIGEKFRLKLMELEAYTNISSGYEFPDFRLRAIDL